MDNKAQDKYDTIQNCKGFIAALDQSGASTPRSLSNYGISSSFYKDEEEMLDLMHTFRTRVITSPCFTSDKILSAILYADTVSKKIDDKYTAQYLWDTKGIPSFAKIDNGTEQKYCGVQLLNSIPGLFRIIEGLKSKGLSGIKMRSVIHDANPRGIQRVITQQFQIANAALEHELIPIIEPEVLINSYKKAEADMILLDEISKHLSALPPHQQVILKVSIPNNKGMYKELIDHPNVMHVAALSGGDKQQTAVDKLTENPGMIASFSRALFEGLHVDQSDEEFNDTLSNSIDNIYRASIE